MVMKFFTNRPSRDSQLCNKKRPRLHRTNFTATPCEKALKSNIRNTLSLMRGHSSFHSPPDLRLLFSHCLYNFDKATRIPTRKRNVNNSRTMNTCCTIGEVRLSCQYQSTAHHPIVKCQPVDFTENGNHFPPIGFLWPRPLWTIKYSLGFDSRDVAKERGVAAVMEGGNGGVGEGFMH